MPRSQPPRKRRKTSRPRGAGKKALLPPWIVKLLRSIKLSPRDSAKYSLIGIMEELSEKHWCAGWADGCEIDLWRASHSTATEGFPWGQYAIPPETCRELKNLAEAGKGWWIHRQTSCACGVKTKADSTFTSRVFVPLKQWKGLFNRLTAPRPTPPLLDEPGESGKR